MEPDSLEAWFKREILSHEAALTRYLYRCWHVAADVTDLRQEVYIRVYEAATHSRPHHPKSFLFATARNLLADRLRQERIVTIEAVGDLDALDLLIDEFSAEKRVSAYQELHLLAEAIDRLPPRCREVVWLRRVDELSYKEIASRLGVTCKTVEKQITKSMRLLADAMSRDIVSQRDSDGYADPAREMADEGSRMDAPHKDRRRPHARARS